MLPTFLHLYLLQGGLGVLSILGLLAHRALRAVQVGLVAPEDLCLVYQGGICVQEAGAEEEDLEAYSVRQRATS